jgi:YfdX protein
MDVKERLRPKCLTRVALLVILLAPNGGPAFGSSTNQGGLKPYLDSSWTPDEESIVATYASRAVRNIAMVRRDLSQKRIPDAQNDLGKALTDIDRMKSRFVTSRLQELVEAARIRLTYEQPNQVLNYLDSITPLLTDIQEPRASQEAHYALERAKSALKSNDKKGADNELALLDDGLIYNTATRPLALAERSLLQAAAELDQERIGSAERSLDSAEARLRSMAIELNTPVSRAKEQLKQAAVHESAGRWSDVKTDLQDASNFFDEALKRASAAGRDDLRELKRDTESIINRVKEGGGKHFSGSVASLLKRIDAVQQRGLEYNTAAWEKFQASSPGSEDLIDAKLHLRFAEIYEFTTGENDKARAELNKAESYVEKAKSQVSKDKKSELTELIKEIAVTKADIGKYSAEQNKRYAALGTTLTQLVQ